MDVLVLNFLFSFILGCLFSTVYIFIVMLSKTAKATKTHFYWAMRNNDGTDAGFQ